MNNRLDIDLAQMGKKWVACFDLLGFSQLTSTSLINAFYQIELCLFDLKFWEERKPKLGIAWFSDTFLIYAPNDSAGSLVAIETVARHFFQIVLLRRIPMRGAMVCDEFYADKANGIYVGKALVDAVRFGEKCNWVGYVLHPSTVCQMEKVNLPATSGSYSERYKTWKVPIKKVLRRGKNRKEEIVEGSEEVKALLCGAIEGNSRDFIAALEAMSEQTDKPNYKVKYTNSIRFMKHFGVVVK
jgi:hypothetical protein